MTNGRGRPLTPEERVKVHTESAEMLTLMMKARAGDVASQERVSAISRLKERQSLVEACRLALCKQLGIRAGTPLLKLMNVQQVIPLQAPPSPKALSSREFRGRAPRCTQCGAPAMPGDNRCYLHIK